MASDALDRGLPALATVDAERSRQALLHLAVFARSGSLADLDRGRGLLQEQLARWNHWQAVARACGTPWPLPAPTAPELRVTRQSGRSRAVWSCSACGWEVAWSVEAEPWEQLEWNAGQECPLCTSGQLGACQNQQR